jgi:hypothetical protein
MIKDKIIRQASEEEIKDYCAEEGYTSHREQLPDDVGPWPSRNELFPEDCWWGRLEESGQGFSKAGKPCGTLCRLLKWSKFGPNVVQDVMVTEL